MKKFIGWLLLYVRTMMVRKGSHLLGLMAVLLILHCSNPITREEVIITPVTHSQTYAITIVFTDNDSIQRGADLYYKRGNWSFTALLDTTVLTFTNEWTAMPDDSIRLLSIDIKYHVWLLNNDDEKVLREQSIQTYNTITVIEEG